MPATTQPGAMRSAAAVGATPRTTRKPALTSPGWGAVQTACPQHRASGNALFSRKPLHKDQLVRPKDLDGPAGSRVARPEKQRGVTGGSVFFLELLVFFVIIEIVIIV